MQVWELALCGLTILLIAGSARARAVLLRLHGPCPGRDRAIEQMVSRLPHAASRTTRRDLRRFSACHRSCCNCWLSQLSAVVLNAIDKRTAISGLIPLTPGAKPRYDTVLKVLQSLGVKLTVSAA